MTEVLGDCFDHQNFAQRAFGQVCREVGFKAIRNLNMKQHVCVQDEMIEIGEREEQALGEERAAAEKATHEALMKEANLDGAEALADVMVSHISCISTSSDAKP